MSNINTLERTTQRVWSHFLSKPLAFLVVFLLPTCLLRSNTWQQRPTGVKIESSRYTICFKLRTVYRRARGSKKPSTTNLWYSHHHKSTVPPESTSSFMKGRGGILTFPFRVITAGYWLGADQVVWEASEDFGNYLFSLSTNYPKHYDLLVNKIGLSSTWLQIHLKNASTISLTCLF